MRRAVLGFLLALAALPVAGPALGQGLLPGRGSGPVTIEADDGIEWRRDDRVYIASGNAKAIRGDVTVTARRLVARYRERPGVARAGAGEEGLGGGTDIYRLEAEGDVVIRTPTETAWGRRAVYDVDQAVLVLTGDNLRMVTAEDVVTARDSLEYWESRKVAVARGDAVSVRGDRRVQGDVLTAHIQEDPKTGQSRISKVDVFGNARVSTPKETATGSKGVYNLDTNIATLVGDVKVSQGRNQLNGEYSEVNMTTGVARMLSGPAAGRAGGRVRGLLMPEEGKPPAGTQPVRRTTVGR